MSPCVLPSQSGASQRQRPALAAPERAGAGVEGAGGGSARRWGPAHSLLSHGRVWAPSSILVSARSSEPLGPPHPVTDTAGASAGVLGGGVHGVLPPSAPAPELGGGKFKIFSNYLLPVLSGPGPSDLGLLQCNDVSRSGEPARTAEARRTETRALPLASQLCDLWGSLNLSESQSPYPEHGCKNRLGSQEVFLVRLSSRLPPHPGSKEPGTGQRVGGQTHRPSSSPRIPGCFPVGPTSGNHTSRSQNSDDTVWP